MQLYFNRKLMVCTIVISAGVEYTSFGYQYATFKINKYMVLESSTSTQNPSMSTQVLFSIF